MYPGIHPAGPPPFDNIQRHSLNHVMTTAYPCSCAVIVRTSVGPVALVSSVYPIRLGVSFGCRGIPAGPGDASSSFIMVSSIEGHDVPEDAQCNSDVSNPRWSFAAWLWEKSRREFIEFTVGENDGTLVESVSNHSKQSLQLYTNAGL